MGTGALDTGAASENPPPAPDRSSTSRTRQVLALLTAAALGFGASEVLDEQRQAALERSPEGSLSLQAQPVEAPVLGTDADADRQLSLPVELRNTGPVAVVLETVQLVGTGLLDASAVGRSLPAGATTQVVLAGPVDCMATLTPGPLVVTARTPAGSREVRLPLAPEATGPVTDQEREACGRQSPGEALQFEASVSQVRDGVGRLPVRLRNRSAQDLEVVAVLPVEGLRLELLDAAGEPVILPLPLPGADFGTPLQRSTAGPDTRLTAVFTADCSSLPAEPPQRGRPLLDIVVVAPSGGPSETRGYGDGDRLLRRLVEVSCVQADGARR